MAEAAKLRAELKKKKPKFVRQESHRRKRLGKKWRKPRGVHSKIRLGRRGKPPRVKIGYRLPRTIRGLHKSGLKPVSISNLSQLEKLDKTNQIATLSSRLGKKKKLAILKRAIELDIKFTNIKDLKKEIAAIEKEMKERKEKKAKKKETRKKAKEIKTVAPKKEETKK